MRTGDLALQIMRQHAASLAEHARQAQSGSDPEQIHQARVATRRLRAALRVFGDVLASDVPALRDELKWIASRLGAVRDLDVQLNRLESNAARLGLAEQLDAYRRWLDDKRQRALDAFCEASQSPRFGQLTEALQELNQVGLPPEAELPLEDYARQRLRRAARQLRKRGDHLRASSPDAAFHQARIRAKRLRYTTEFFEPIYGKPARRLIKAATYLQDLLGDLQDGIVDTRCIREAVQAAGGAWSAEATLALGQVIQWESEHGAELRRAFKGVYGDVEDAWRRLGKAL